jgi:germination protein M
MAARAALRGATTMSGVKYVPVTIGIVLAGLLGVIVASCGAGGGAQSAGPVPTSAGAKGGGVETSNTQVDTLGSVETNTPTETSGGGVASPTVTYQVWFHRGERMFVVRRTERATPRVGTHALDALLTGPTEPERVVGVQTQVPDGTQLLGLSIEKGIATVDLTSEFESGGGTASLTMRLAQVVYTLTQFPTVKGVRFALDGTPVDVLGGEGIVIDHPLTRRDYADLLPPILVETPTVGQPVGSPVTVSGTANVFEANVTVRILDADRKELARTFTTATCGTGCRGSFSVSVPYVVADGKEEGTIVVQDDDAAGTGHPPHEVRIPVVLEPTS